MDEPGPLDRDAADVPASKPRDVTLVDGRTFAISDVAGDMWDVTHGLMHDDLRHLSEFTVRTPGREIEVLTGTTVSPFSGAFVQRLRLDHEPEGAALLMVRRRWIGDGLREDIELTNPTGTAVVVDLTLRVGADFAHLFDVKAGYGGEPGALVPDGDAWRIVAPNDTHTGSRVECHPRPDLVDLAIGTLVWRVDLAPRASVGLCLTVEPIVDDVRADIQFPCTMRPNDAIPLRRLHSWRESIPRLQSRDTRLRTAFDQALADLASLHIVDDAHPDRVLVAAGAPWFMTVFGRDSLLTAWMTLPFDASLARGVLLTLADLQGTIDDPTADEEPGKILHELRRHGGGGPFATRSRYYGTVDATPLFVMLAAEAWRWGALTALDLQALGPAVDRALDWLDRFLDDERFVSYARREASGLSNQGWKDSWDGISSAGGEIPSAPISLVEVQGYTFAALVGGADLAGPMELRHDRPALLRRARRFRDQFNAAFWDERGYYVLGLDGSGRPIDALTSNPGHALWAGIADPEGANRYLDLVMGADLWSGWGVRTLGEAMNRYHPLSYHNGSVWPHDTAIVAAGAARYGRWDVVDALVDGALAAASHFAGRPPELFAGLSRTSVPVPVPYPSSCSPQAWSSASILLHVRSMVGLDVNPEQDALVVTRPTHDADVELHGLVFAGQHWDLSVDEGRSQFTR
ncbi:MAG: glycogen debranching N-terminal domain-containing protein [Acidimicrobiia bacterium]